MQRLRTGLPRRAAGRDDGASLRIPRRRSGADTSETGRNPDAAARRLLWENYPSISRRHGRLRRRNAASMVPRIFHSERALAETGRSCALSAQRKRKGAGQTGCEHTLSAGDSLPALTMAGCVRRRSLRSASTGGRKLHIRSRLLPFRPAPAALSCRTRRTVGNLIHYIFARTRELRLVSNLNPATIL